MKVHNEMEFTQALDAGEKTVELANSMSMTQTVVLQPGQKLVAEGDGVFLSFIQGDGLGLSGDNEVRNIAIQTAPDRWAIYLNSALEDLKTILLKDLTLTGVLQILTRGKNKKLKLHLDHVDVVAADARAFPERPMKYGVNVYQGAVTIYNFNPAEDSEIEVVADHVSVGRDKAPVLGSGIFISGFNDDTGKVRVEKLVTGDVYSNGMIPTGQPNLITGGIFMVYGVQAKEIVSQGLVTTYGTNDMVLDVWGEVDSWTVHKDVTSYGPSGIGFVNFGLVKNFRSEGTIATYGLGARGFNQYDGTIDQAYFERIVTLGDGSVGMQFSKPVGQITIGQGVTTSGSSGQTLVKGVIKELKADALSVLEGGRIESLEIQGDLVTKGEDVVTYHVQGGQVKEMKVAGKVLAEGKGAKAVVIEGGGQSDVTDLKAYLE